MDLALVVRDREACKRARWPEQHRDDCQWCAYIAAGGPMQQATDVDYAAAKLASEHGTFTLTFDHTQNYVKSDDMPWILTLNSGLSAHDGLKAWSGFTALSTIEFAHDELGRPVAPA